MQPPNLPSSRPSAPVGLKIVMFILWYAILQGLFIIRLFAAPKGMSMEGLPLTIDLSMIGWIGMAGAAASMVIRWIVAPKIKDPAATLPAMIIGVALAEGCGIFGMFVVQDVAERNLLFYVSVVCVVLSAPIYLLMRPKEPSPYRQS